MNKLVGEREWSAQEVCHLLLNLPLSSGSRTVLNVNCRPLDQQPSYITIEDGEVKTAGKSIFEKYMDRPPDLSNLTLLDFLRNFDHRSYRKRPRAPPRVLQYFPRYKAERDSVQYEDYCRVKMMLHHPFRDIDDLLNHEDGKFSTWVDAYAVCRSTHGHHDPDGLPKEIQVPDDDEFEDDSCDGDADDDPDPEGYWQELAAERPNRRADREEDPDRLGHRDIDRVDWSSRVNSYPELDSDWWDHQKTAHPAQLTVAYASTAAVNTLQGKQRQVYDAVVDHYQQTLDADLDSRVPGPRQLLLQVDGKAGTGKSHVIWILSSRLQEMAAAHGRQNPIFRTAPTGVAAHNVSGRTLHSLFRLPVKSAFTELSIPALTAAQNDLRHCQYLIIDEKSMLSLKQLGWLDRRCRQIFPNCANEVFGGLNIILCGDFFQLPPVGSKPLFSTLDGSVDEVQGRRAYRSFDKTIELDVIMRQQGDSEEQQDFRNALQGLRHSCVTLKHWETLTSRVQSNLTPTEVATFDTALRIYGKKADVNAFNHARMRDLQKPVLVVEASHEPASGKNATSDEAGNLHASLPLCLGARVMLTENIWTENGLVNGALGTVRDITWSAGSDWRRDPPFAVLVAFDNYKGPALDGDEGSKVVPIFRSTREFIRSSTPHRRTQFPLTVAYAITVHKSQGITVEKAVLNLKEKDFAPGLSYVGVGRVKSLKGLMLEESFDLARFRNKESITERMRLADYERRRHQHLEL